MKVNLYLFKNFNNYFNRRIKKYTLLRSYIDSSSDFYSLKETNFNPNDGITTEHVIGSANNKFSNLWSPDYVVVTDFDDNIISRWFVIEFSRLMNSQYRMNLKRDSIADKYDIVTQSPCFIEKATVNKYDPFIVNSEKMNLNQIKIREYYIKDKSRCPWAVCYIPQERDDKAVTKVFVKTNLPPDPTIPSIDSNPTMKEIFLKGGTFNPNPEDVVNLVDDNIAIKWSMSYWDIMYHVAIYFYEINGNSTQGFIGEKGTGSIVDGDIDKQTLLNLAPAFAKKLNDNYSEIFNLLKQYSFTRSNRINGNLDVPATDSIWQYNRHYYRLKVEMQSTGFDEGVRAQDSAILSSLVQEVYGRPITKEAYETLGACNANKEVIKCSLEEITKGDAYYEYSHNTNHLNEVPYDIIAFPLENTTVKVSGGTISHQRDIALAAARSIVLAVGRAYDVQILPFCPYPDAIKDNGEIDLTNFTEDKDYIVIYRGVDKSEKLGIGLIPVKAYQYIKISKLGLYVAHDEEEDVGDVLKIIDRKEQNETETFRLCSPNYSAMFEFNVSKLIPLHHDKVDWLDVDVNFRPYTPYIRVAPKFGFLYYQNYSDARGLICNGNFSITLVDDKFQTYELNNKNYQLIFNREINNMEVNRDIAREQESWNISKSGVNLVTSYLGTLISMGLGNAMFGELGGVGAGVAGLRGMLNSGMGHAGAIKQKDWNERAYQESRDFKEDMFNYNLENIRALPSSITQSSAISNNFKFFPVLEVYTCTSQEKEAYRDKIKYNGMTVGRIGQIKDYLSNDEERFVKGQIIRLEGLGEDSHLANDIYQEISKGLFFNPDETINWR